MLIAFSFQYFLTEPQNSKSLKYWANNESGFKTGLFSSTKILEKTQQMISLHKTSKMGLVLMSMSKNGESNIFLGDFMSNLGSKTAKKM